MYFEIMNLVLVALGVFTLFFGVVTLSNRPGKRISSRSERRPSGGASTSDSGDGGFSYGSYDGGDSGGGGDGGGE